jgi:hypothetical protein
MTTAQHLSLSNEHYTPLDIVNRVKAVFDGVIDTDPATSEQVNNLRVKAKKIYTIENDGLDPQNKWRGNVFLNPPGGKTNNKSNAAIWLNAAYWKYYDKEINSLIFVGFNIEIIRIYVCYWFG